MGVCSSTMSAPPGVIAKAAAGLANLAAVLGAVLFVSAGTLRFFEGWMFLAIFTSASLAITVYLARKDPALLERRTQAGPLAEKERSQKVIQGIAGLAFLATVAVPALDHRFGWTHAPPIAIVAGDAFVGAGFWIVYRVFRANTFTSAVIEVAGEQQVIDTGPYAVVRHPMYAGALVLIAGIPLALGSLVGLAMLVPFVGILVWRLRDEERFLARELRGYAEYQTKTRYRLLPGIY